MLDICVFTEPRKSTKRISLMHKRSLFLYALFASQLLFVQQALTQDTTAPTVELLTPAPGSTVVRLFEIEVLQRRPSGVMPVTVDQWHAGNGLLRWRIGALSIQLHPTGEWNCDLQWAAGHGITDTNNNAFVAPGSWTYTLDPTLANNLVRINEFLANNNTGIRDEDGTFQDWIEIFNGSIIPVNLNGWSLTDDKLLLTRWRFPTNATLPPNTYLIVWASDKNRTNAAAPMHTNFRLDPSPGEFLALVDPSGTNFVSVYDPYPTQVADISYGHDPIDPGIVGFYSKPTPGAINSTSGSGFAPPVTFSQPGGTFVNPFSITLSVASTNAEIRYVLVTNSTTASALVTNVPGTNSPLYAGPIPSTGRPRCAFAPSSPENCPALRECDLHPDCFRRPRFSPTALVVV
jgi:hypothetical protein